MKLAKPALLVLMLVATSGSLLNKSVGQNKNASLSEENFLDLARTIYTWSEDEKSKNHEVIGEEQSDEVVRQMRSIIKRSVISAMKRGDLDTAIVKVILPFQTVTGAVGEDFTNSPYAKCFSINVTPYCFVAYMILRGDDAVPDSQCYIDFFSSRTQSEVVSIGVSDFRGHSFFVREVPAKLSGQEWVLAWGNVLGDTGGRLSVRLYSFDGERARTIWSRDGLNFGEVQIFDGFIRLSYDPYYRSPESERKTETFHFTSNGLQ